VLELRKQNFCPLVQAKYSGRPALMNAAELLAVRSAVVSATDAQTGNVETTRIWYVCARKGVVAWVTVPDVTAVTIVRPSLELGCDFHIPIS
jgi:hypothetical protein